MAQSDLRQLKSRSVAGAVAGNIVVTGIKKGDRILSISGFTLAQSGTTPFAVTHTPLGDLTAQFTATADDTINNTGGTSTAGAMLLVLWVAKNPRG